MKRNISRLFHTASKDHAEGRPFISANAEEWPDEWKTTYYKSYPRLPKISLLNPSHGSPSIFDLIERRNSDRNFSDSPIAKSDLSLLLRYGCGITGKFIDERHRRAQPSGGARFPLEMYSLVLYGDADVPAGVYHYGVKDHALVVLAQRQLPGEEIDSLFTYSWVKHASVVFILTAVFERTQDKYGERGYRYVLMEAGHIGQNLYLIAEALGLKCCALGGTHDEKVESLLDIDGVTESVVYAIAIGT